MAETRAAEISRYLKSLCRASCLIHSKGGLIVILWTVLVNQLSIYSNARYLFSYIIKEKDPVNTFWFNIALSLIQFVGFLLYPITGLLADIYWTRYNTMYAGLFFNMLGTIALTIASFLVYYGQITTWAWLFGIVLPLGSLQFGVALFSSNAIQFATDQMPGASSDSLSALVYWYVWAVFFGQGEGSFLLLVLNLFTSLKTAVYLSIIIICVVQAFCLVFGIIAIALLKQKLVNEPAGRNPIKDLAKVLKYSWHHKTSRFDHRSAFTYGVETPSRLDFAKQRFGGPYTTEEVEDTKTFFRVLIVLLSLIGFYLVDETIATNIHMQELRNTLGLTADGAFDYLTMMSFTGSLLTILFFIPVYQCCLQRCIKMPSMLKRMFIGLMFALVGAIILQVIEIVLSVKVQHLTTCSRCELMKNDSTCQEISLLENTTTTLSFNTALLPYQIVIIVQVANGIAFLLVFVTGIEFILAQAPRLMQGFLIGIWHAGACVKISIGIIMSIEAIDCQFYTVAFRIGAMVLFLPIYTITAAKYKRRERDEYATINQQNIIEEYCIRALDRRDKYYEELSNDDTPLVTY